LRNVAATFGPNSVFKTAVRHRGNIVIQRSDIPLSIENLRRMANGNSPFVKNARGEWEALNLHHVGRQDGKLIEILSSHNAYDPITGGPLHIPGPGGPLRQSRLSITYWQQRLEDLISSGQVSEDLLRQLGR
ncbi:MAG: HNH/ENDO VII family nuclease, partial [Planctomycetota bacterium]